jgi:hypothetical protein
MLNYLYNFLRRAYHPTKIAAPAGNRLVLHRTFQHTSKPLKTVQRFFIKTLLMEVFTMTRKIFGTIVDVNSGGTPVKGLRIRAWDEDWPDGDDYMGKDFTDERGQYQISYNDGFWDRSLPGLSTWYPDIYITLEIRNAAGKWVHFGKSQVHKDHKLDQDLRIDLNIRIAQGIKSESAFSPTDDGFHFINSFKISASLFGLDIKDKGMGFCGGMCAGALNRFNNKINVPGDHQAPKQGTKLFNELLKRQVRAMHPIVLAKMYSFQSAPDQVNPFRKTSIGQLTKKEWPKLKTALDNGQPTILILIRSSGVFGNPTMNHQVLATGYKFNPATKDLVIYEYDPNKPDQTHTLSMNLGLPDRRLYFKDSAKKTTRGFFVSPVEESASADIDQD